MKTTGVDARDDGLFSRPDGRRRRRLRRLHGAAAAAIVRIRTTAAVYLQRVTTSAQQTSDTADTLVLFFTFSATTSGKPKAVRSPPAHGGEKHIYLINFFFFLNIENYISNDLTGSGGTCVQRRACDRLRRNRHDVWRWKTLDDKRTCEYFPNGKTAKNEENNRFPNRSIRRVRFTLYFTHTPPPPHTHTHARTDTTHVVHRVHPPCYVGSDRARAA